METINSKVSVSDDGDPVQVSGNCESVRVYVDDGDIYVVYVDENGNDVKVINPRIVDGEGVGYV